MKKRSMWTGALVLACGLSFGPAAFGQAAGGGAGGGTAGGGPGAAGAQGSQQQQTGQARVRTREGPRIEVRPHHRPVIVAVFMNPQQSQQQDALEITAFIPGADESAQPREIVFDGRSATQNGIVTHRMDQAIGGGGGGSAAQGQGQAQQERPRHLMFTARRGSQDAQIQELSGGQNVRILAIRRAEPQVAQQGQQGQQAQQAQQGQQAGQQGQQGGQQGQGQGQQAQGEQAQGDQAQQAAAQQQAEQQRQQQQQQQQQEQQRQAAREQNDAIVFVYLQGEQQ
jgi:hypothetical protein